MGWEFEEAGKFINLELSRTAFPGAAEDQNKDRAMGSMHKDGNLKSAINLLKLVAVY